MSIIELKHISRDYEYTTGWFKKKKHIKHALKDVSLFINEGEIFGLLGENGAGKTTTIKILSTLLLPTSGTCTLMNFNIYKEEKHIRKHINFIFGGETGLYPRLSGKDNLLYFANLYKLDSSLATNRIGKLLELVGMSNDADKLVETYSKGMIQRMQIAKGLINDPKIILMDEPTIGLDPLGAKMLRNIIKQLKSEGKTVIITTHYMAEADELCDRIAFIKNGEIIAINTPEYFKHQILESKQIEVVFNELESFDSTIVESVEGVQSTYFEQSKLIINYKKELDLTNELFNLLKQYNIISFTNKEMQLEDVYVHLLGDLKND